MRISVENHRELQAVVLALKQIPRDLRNDINRSTTRELGPVWKQLVQAGATYARDDKVLARGARLAGGNPPTLYAANSGRKMRGGLVPKNDWGGFEFGAARNAKVTYTRKSKNGGTHKVTRHTKRQMPQRSPRGRAIWPAYTKIAPRLAALWTQLAVKKLYDAWEGGK